MEGVDHTVSVTASSLYEAVALGPVALRGEEWVDGIAGGLNAVRVTAISVPVEHYVTMKHFQRWLEGQGHRPELGVFSAVAD